MSEAKVTTAPFFDNRADTVTPAIADRRSAAAEEDEVSSLAVHFFIFSFARSDGVWRN